MLKKLALSAAALAFCLPAGAASAQSFGYYWDRAQAEDHGDFHEQEEIAHAEAHERGFSSPEEHEAWHQNAERAHEAYHEDHPDAWGDYGWNSYYGGYYPYRRYYHVRRHYYGYPYGYRTYEPSVSFSFGF